jgi:hypothetical protein
MTPRETVTPDDAHCSKARSGAQSKETNPSARFRKAIGTTTRFTNIAIGVIWCIKNTLQGKTEIHDPMLAALRNAGGKQVSELRLDSDHAFSDARIALARGVVDFLQQHCR